MAGHIPRQMSITEMPIRHLCQIDVDEGQQQQFVFTDGVGLQNFFFSEMVRVAL